MQLSCPWCGQRNVSEFRSHGELAERPVVGSTSPEEWRRYLYFRRNPHGWVEEKWFHSAGCRRFFRVRRNTASNENVSLAVGGEGTR